MKGKRWPANGGTTLLSLALWLTGCATVVDHRVEQLIAAELPRVIGAAARYDVDVAGVRGLTKASASSACALLVRE